MISRTFITKYLKLFFPNYDERYLDLLEIISDFTDPYIEASNMAIIALDQNKRIVMVNQLAATLFNTSETALLEQEVGQALPVCPLSKVTLDNYAALPKEFSMGEKTVHAERTPIIHDEKTIAVVSFLYEHSDTDTTDQRSIETQKHMQFLNEIIENSYDGIYITDSSGKTILVNKAYERIFGVPRSQLIGEYMKDLVTKGILSTSITQDVVEKKEVITRTQTNANNKEVFITGNPIFDEEGNVHHVITNVRDITELISLNKKLQAEIDRADLYQSQLMKESSDENIVCNSQEFSSILNIARKISRMDSTVLILGETGVGKEIVAQYIHKHSMRDDKPYIKINCGAIPQNLLESELFGYVPGAFTGASAKGKSGMFELADTGTLFLDEIGELPINLQSALLRVLQDHEVTRVGGQKSKKVDVRIVAATNQNLEEMIEEGTFRSDLYYRLNVVSINIPPLRERKDDIPKLAEKTLENLNQKYGVHKVMSPHFIRHLLRGDWPGNVRELRNFIEKQFVLSDETILDAPVTSSFAAKQTPSTEEENSSLPSIEAPLPTYAQARETMERDLIKRAMKQGGSTYKAAALLDMSQPTFFRKYKEHFPDGIE